MSFLKSLFGGKQDSKKSSCCDVKIVEVKDGEVAASASDENKTNTDKK